MTAGRLPREVRGEGPGRPGEIGSVVLYSTNLTVLDLIDQSKQLLG